ncbi:MAG: GNAT family N-acetyltransferase, partial [Candidatus Hodarchaeales archaeon]
MVQKIPHDQLGKFLPLFSEHRFFRTILEAIPHVPIGEGFVDDLDRPEVILFSVGEGSMGDCFLAGNYRSPKVGEILAQVPERRSIHVPSREWVPVMKDYWEYFGYLPRTDFSADDLTVDHVEHLLTPLPEDFEVEKAGLETAKQIDDFTYPGGPEAYFKDGGLLFCVKKGDKVVSQVSALAKFGYEIDVATQPEYRGRGFATLVCAKFIKYCLEHGIKPHWDAANEISVALALKLGFTNPQRYRCYYWRSKPWTVSELKARFDPQYKTVLQDLESFKSELETLLANSRLEEAKELLQVGCMRIKGAFMRITSDVTRLIETGLVEKADEPQFKDYV